MKMEMQVKTIELISKFMGDHSTGFELIKFLEGHGVQKNIIVYPNTKWVMVYDVLCWLSRSEKKEDNQKAFQIIASFVHPLNLGSETNSEAAIKTFNSWLKYDNLEIINTGNGIDVIEISNEPPDEYWDQIFEEHQLLATRTIKQFHLNDLILLKKSYQLLISIVNEFFQNDCRPSEKLNEAYLKTVKMSKNAMQQVFSNPQIKKFNIQAIMPAGTFYRPFNNLYGAEEELHGIYLEDRISIKQKMNKYFGEILNLSIECGAGDILKESDSQKMINEITLYLTELKEKNDNGSSGTTKSNPYWMKDFKFDGKKYIFGKLGSIEFASSERKRLFMLLTDAKGGWVPMSRLRGAKDDNYVRATIRQIEERMSPALRRKVSITSTLEDDLEPKPSQGAYRIKIARHNKPL